MSFSDEAIARWGEDRGEPRPAGPDPERDRRIEVYRDRERRRAARALDRYIEICFGAPGPMPREMARAAMVASDRFVEAVGDYVLSRLQQKSHYVVTDPCGDPYCSADPVHAHKSAGPEPGSTCQECSFSPGPCPTPVKCGFTHPCAGGRCSDAEAHAEGAHEL